MAESNYWQTGTRQILSRRRLIGAVPGGGLAVAAWGLVACSGRPAKKPGSGAGNAATASAQSTPRRGGVVNSAAAGNFPLDPQKGSSIQAQISGVLSRLFQFKTGPDPIAFTAHDIDADLGLTAESPDAVTWTVKLRTGARFTNIPPVNGHAVEAEDVKATFTRALDPATSNPNSGSLNMIDPAQIQTPDHQTVIFKLAYPYAPFKATLASPAYSWILAREALAGSYDPMKTVIGSGPFILDKATPDVAYVYKRNPDYYNQDLPYIDGGRGAVVPDPAQVLAQFTAGKLDFYGGADANTVGHVAQQNPRATLLRVASGTPYPLYFQLGDPSSPFQDIRLRRAVSMAVDRDAIGKVVFAGQGEQTVFVPGYMGKWSLPVDKLDASTQQYYQYNPSEVKKLLAAAGHSNLQVRLVNPFFSLGNATIAKQVEVINQSFSAAGIASQIVNGDFNKDFVDGGRGWRQGFFDKDMVIFGAAANYTEADEWLFTYFHSKSTSNQEHLNDATYDAMVDKERTLVDADERLKAIFDIQKYLAQQVYAPSTVGSFAYLLVASRVHNYQYTNSQGVGTESTAKLWLAS